MGKGTLSNVERTRRLPRNEFERMVVVEFPASVNLARRLVDGSLNAQETVTLERARNILAWREEGLKGAQIAERLGLQMSGYAALCQRANFRLMCRWLRERQIIVDKRAEQTAEKSERARLERLGAPALDYLEDAFARDPKTGRYLDVKRAERATALIAKGKGWDEPERQLGIIGELSVTLVMAKGADVRASDVLRAQARLTTVDVQPERATTLMPCPHFRPEECAVCGPPQLAAPTAGINELFSHDADEPDADDDYEDGPIFVPDRAPPGAAAPPLAAPEPEEIEGSEQ
jgi:hypothetical protein